MAAEWERKVLTYNLRMRGFDQRNSGRGPHFLVKAALIGQRLSDVESHEGAPPRRNGRLVTLHSVPVRLGVTGGILVVPT